MPFSISKLNRHLIGKSLEVVNEDGVTDHCTNYKKYTADNKIYVLKMPLSLFHKCLLNHFDIRFKKEIFCLASLYPKTIENMRIQINKYYYL